MYAVEKTAEFDAWLLGLRNSKARKVIAKRIDVISSGSLGETRSLGDSLFEAKIRYGPGYRLYFINKDGRIIVLLCGGDKSTQKRDIAKARDMAKEL